MQHHHKLIASLITEIRSLRSHLDDVSEYAEERSERYRRDIARLREQSAYEARRAAEERREREAREWDRENLMTEYQKYKNRGDDWSADRTMRKLRNI